MNTNAKRLIILHILEETKKGTLDLNKTLDSIKITREAFTSLLKELYTNNYINLEANKLIVTFDQRLKLSVMAINLGSDFENVSKILGWQEFEEFVAHIFRENGYNTTNRFRFKAEGRRWEIDVLATSFPYILCVECKHYKTSLGNSTIRNFIEIHIEKTDVLSKHICYLAKKIGINGWNKAILVPITLTLSPTKMKIYRRVPNVSVFMLPSFLSEFQGYLGRMIHYVVDIKEYEFKPKQLRLK